MGDDGLPPSGTHGPVAVVTLTVAERFDGTIFRLRHGTPGSPDVGYDSMTTRQPEALMMEYLVNMTTHVPDGTSEQTVDEIRTREAARSRELAAQGHLLRLWRPPLQPGEWRTLGLFSADDASQLEQVLASMPLRVWRTDEVTPLTPHPNDPALSRR